MGRYEKNLICMPMNFKENIWKQWNQNTENSWEHTYKIAHTSAGISLSRLNLAQNQSQDNSFNMTPSVLL